MITLQSATKFEELLGTDVESTPYNYAMLFKADGFLARRRAKKRFKLLQSIDAKLRLMLEANEKVYFLTHGTTISLSEQFFVGWLAYFLNMYALVFTSNRMLLLQVDRARRPRDLVSQMPYGVIASVKSTWNALCRVKLLDKKIYDFQHVPAADRKFLAKFLIGVVRGSSAPFQYGHGIEHLCPHCFKVVPGHPLTCPACHGSFKPAWKAGLLSFFFPGLGQWYLGQRAFAVFEVFCAAMLWLGLLVLLPHFFPAVLNYPVFGRGYWLVAGLALLAMHLVDGLMTRHFARKGHYPAAKGGDQTGESATMNPAMNMPKPDLSAAKKTLSIRRDTPTGNGE